MGIHGFINFYDVLKVAPDAELAEIEQRFRALARRYHPDNQTTGDRSRFDLILQAHETLKDAAKRADYHREHQTVLGPLAHSVEEESEDGSAADGADADCGVGDGVNIADDISVQNKLLTILYLNRRRNINAAGMGDAELEHLSGCPTEHLEFHLWYLKAKGWVATSDNGLLAITIEGVDRAAHIHQADGDKKLITDRS